MKAKEGGGGCNVVFVQLVRNSRAGQGNHFGPECHNHFFGSSTSYNEIGPSPLSTM